MIGSRVIQKARRLRIQLDVDGDHLHYKAPLGTISGKLLEALSLLKFDIIAILRAPGEHEVCAYFCGDPKVDRYCRACGGTWQDYVYYVTGAVQTKLCEFRAFESCRGPVALEDELIPGYTPVKDNLDALAEDGP